MKITKGRLKEIIKEELANEASGRIPMATSGGSGFPTLTTPQTPDAPGHDHFATLKALYGAASADGLPRELLTQVSLAARILADYLEEQE